MTTKEKNEQVSMAQEQKQMKEALFKVLRNDVLLSEEQSMDLAEEYGTLSNIATAIKNGSNFGIKDKETKEKLALIGRSW